MTDKEFKKYLDEKNKATIRGVSIKISRRRTRSQIKKLKRGTTSIPAKV
jgi:hypothetical protein